MKRILFALSLLLACGVARAQSPAAGSVPTLTPVTTVAPTDELLDEQVNLSSSTGWSARGLTAAQLQSFVLAGASGFQSDSISAASTVTLTKPAGQKISIDQITLGAGSGAYAVARALSDSNAAAGDQWIINIIWPTSANPTVSVTDATSAAVLDAPAGTAQGGYSTLTFGFNGTAWVALKKGELDTRNLGAGVLAPTAQPINSTNSLVATDANGNLVQDAHAAGPSNVSDTFAGDSITYGTNATHGSTDFPTVLGTLSYFHNHSTINNEGQPGAFVKAGTGFPSNGAGQTVTGTWSVGATTVALTTSPTGFYSGCPISVTCGTAFPYGETGTVTGSTLALSKPASTAGSAATITLGGNNITDLFPSMVFPHRPWATSSSTAGTGTITGDSNITITGTGTTFESQLAVGGTIYFNGQRFTVASISSNTSLTVSSSLASNNPSGASYTVGGDGGNLARLWVMCGINACNGGYSSSTTIAADLNTYSTMAQGYGFTVYLMTILPDGAESGGADYPIFRQTANLAIRTGQVSCARWFDTASVLSNPMDTNLFSSSDQLHPTVLGYKIIANSSTRKWSKAPRTSRPTQIPSRTRLLSIWIRSPRTSSFRARRVISSLQQERPAPIIRLISAGITGRQL